MREEMEACPAARCGCDGTRRGMTSRHLPTAAGGCWSRFTGGFARRFPLAAILVLAVITPAAVADPWKSITVAESPNLLGDEIQFLTPARDGKSLFVGTLQGVTRLRGDALEKVLDAVGDPKSPQPPKAWSVTERADGTLWIGHERGVTRLKGAERKDFLPKLQVTPVIEVRPGVLWALGKQAGSPDSGVYSLEGEEWKRVPGSEMFQIDDITQAADGRVWAIVDGNGVLEIDLETGFAKAAHHLQGITVTTIQDLPAADGQARRIWAGTWTRGVAVWDGKAWANHLENVKESSVLQIARDTAGTTWVGTSASGVFHAAADLANWSQELADEGSINLLVTDTAGGVWVSGQQTGGLRRRAAGTWTVSLDSPLPIQSLVETADGRLVAGGVLDGLHILAAPPKGTP